MSVAEKEYPDIVGPRPDEPAQFESYIPASTQLRELTLLPIVIAAEDRGKLELKPPCKIVAGAREGDYRVKCE